MQKTIPKYFFYFIIVVLCLNSIQTLAITDLSFTINKLESLENDYLSMRDINLSIAFQQDNIIQLKLTTNTVSTKIIDNIKSIEISCNLTKQTNNIYQCANGELWIEHPLFNKKSFIDFTYHPQDGLQYLKLNKLKFLNGEHNIYASKNNDQWLVEYDAKNTSLDLLSNLLAKQKSDLTEYPIEKGNLDIISRISITKNKITSMYIDATIKQLTMDAEQVMENVSLTSRFELIQDDNHWHFNNKTLLNTGAMYLVPGFDLFDQKP